MKNRLLIVLRILCFVLAPTLILFCLIPFASKSDSDTYAEDSFSKVFIRTDRSFSYEDTMCELEIVYANLYICIEESNEARDAFENKYLEFSGYKICPDVNGAFNSLGESYNTYLDLLSKVEMYYTLYEEYYNIIQSNVIISPETIQKDTSKVLDEKEKIVSDYLAAKQLADDLYSQDYDLLCRIVDAEAGGCSAEEQWLVAFVIYNRVKHPNYPNTLYGVVYQPGQYEPVESGTINNTPNKQVRKNMDDFLRGRVEIDVPDNVVYQAKFPQGSRKNDPWLVSEYGHYFCYR